jgi:hypothetical protein
LCPTASGQVRLWAGICALFVSAFRSGVDVGMSERRLDAPTDQRISTVEALAASTAVQTVYE